MEEYSFDKVVASLNKQCVSPKQVLDLLKWLYQTWLSRNQTFPSALGKTDVRTLTREGTIVSVSDCYFGSEYGRVVEERIAAIVEEKPFFLAAQKDLGIQGDAGLFMRFMETLSAKRFPEIQSKNLYGSELSCYLDYNKKTMSQLSLDNGGVISSEAFESYIGKSVMVDTIDNIQNVLGQCSFEDVVYWILHDKSLADHIYSDHEVSGLSNIAGKAPRARWSSITKVCPSSMRSYLRKAFTQTPWIPTESGKKVTCDKASFTKYSLSPILETIHIDYEKILALH
ncbi:MAG: hypothetical protein J6O18_01170, partial [Bacilli bacterium]|nr:hypothetical protein [Bacilli bacterium]